MSLELSSLEQDLLLTEEDEKEEQYRYERMIVEESKVIAPTI